MDLIGQTIDNKYKIISLLGEGGMGTVYEVRHALIGRRLAMKFLHRQYASSPEVVTRFHREAQAAAQIGHDNICEVTDMGTGPDGSPYIVMEYLDGKDLKNVIQDEGKLPPERAAHILAQVLSALEAAHQAGIIHRDMKPENIYITQKSDRPDYVKLLDFGISKFRTLEGEGKGLTQTGTVLGTPYYMSPEQARGDHNIGQATDIYAVGVIMYQMLTGELPFDAPNYNALLIKILTEEPPDPKKLNPAIPDDLVRVIQKAMDREAHQRFQTCKHFKTVLDPYRTITGSSGGITQTQAMRAIAKQSLEATKGKPFTHTSTPLDWEDRKRKEQARHFGGPLIGIGVVVAILIAGGGVYFYTQQNQAPSKTAPLPVAAAVSLAPTETKPAPPTPAPAVPEPAPANAAAQPAAPASITMSIKAVPAEAEIRLDGTLLGSNPYKGSFNHDYNLHQMIVSAEGYESQEQSLVFNRDQTVEVTLSKKASLSGHRSRKDREKAKEMAGSSPTATETAPKIDETESGKHVSIIKVNPSADKKDKKKDNRAIDNVDPW